MVRCEGAQSELMVKFAWLLRWPELSDKEKEVNKRRREIDEEEGR